MPSDASTATLQLSSTTHDTLTNIMGMSKQLIKALEKSDWLDRLLIASALVFFFLVVLFIIKQRIVDRGLRIALWWSRFVPDFSGNVRLLEVEKTGGHDGQCGGLRI
jgi:protein transport protein SEC20